MQRLAGLCSVFFMVSLLVGCAGMEQETKPVIAAPPSHFSAVKTQREFFEGTVVYIRVGSAGPTMDSLESLEPKRQTLLKKKHVKEVDPDKEKVSGEDELEMAIYAMYLQADTSQNREIDEGEALSFKNIYMAGFNSRVGPIKF